MELNAFRSHCQYIMVVCSDNVNVTSPVSDDVSGSFRPSSPVAVATP